MQLFGTSGIRRVVDKDLIQLALRVGLTVGKVYDNEDSWLLIRASGTEPKIRITAEAKGEARVCRLYDSGIRAIKECMEG